MYTYNQITRPLQLIISMGFTMYIHVKQYKQIDLCVKQCSAPHTRVEQKIILFYFGNQFNKRWLYVSGLDVLGQSPKHNICAFIELPCYLNCFIKIAYIMVNKFSDSILICYCC